jgi:hypothetical protein
VGGFDARCASPQAVGRRLEEPGIVDPQLVSGLRSADRRQLEPGKSTNPDDARRARQVEAEREAARIEQLVDHQEALHLGYVALDEGQQSVGFGHGSSEGLAPRPHPRAGDPATSGRDGRAHGSLRRPVQTCRIILPPPLDRHCQETMVSLSGIIQEA